MGTLRNKALGKLLGLVILLIAVLGFTPMLKSVYLYLVAGLFVIFLLSLYYRTNSFRKYIPLFFSVSLYIMMVLCYKLLNISTASNVTILKHVFFFVPILLMPMISEASFSQRQLNWMIGLILVVVMVNIADNIRLCILHPELLLYVNRDSQFEETSEMGNIGGSHWYNAIFFFFTICFFAFLNSSSKFFQSIMLCCSIVSAVFIFFFCLKAAIIVFTVLSIFFLVYAKYIKNFHKMFTSLMIISFFIFLFVSLFADIIINLLESMISSERLLSRLVLLVESDNAEATAGAGTVSARGALWMVSFNTWLSNPIYFLFGVGAPSPSDYGSGVGNHSDFFDSLARYGVIGCLLIFNSFRISYLYIRSLFEKQVRLQLFVIAVLLVLFIITKGVFDSPAIGCTLFFLLPLLSKYSKFHYNSYNI